MTPCTVARQDAAGVRPALARRLSSPAAQFALIFLLSLGVQSMMAVRVALADQRFYATDNPNPGEYGKVAVALVRTGSFADPYMIPTGPTAHHPPLWPAVMAFIYYLFGFTNTAVYVRAALTIASNATLYALLPWAARALGLGTRAGIIAGIVGALIPRAAMELAGHGTMAPAGIAFLLLAVAFARRWNRPPASVGRSAPLGVACGVAFHLLPPLLLVVAGYLAFELWSRRYRRKYVEATCIVAGAVVACAPWAWRNYSALHGLFFVRSNFGLELRIANHPDVDPDFFRTWSRQRTVRHPMENLAEAQKVRQLGEAEYMREARIEALDWIGAHPGEFLRLTALRVAYFWLGSPRLPWRAAFSSVLTVLAFLGLRRALPSLAAPGRAALLVPLATFPLVYYVVSYVPYYSQPLAWLLMLLAAYEVQAWFRAQHQRPAAVE